MLFQISQCLDESAVLRQINGPPNHLLGVLVIGLELYSLDYVSLLELRQDS